MSIQEVANTSVEVVKKNAPEILAVGGVVGILGSVYLTGRASFHAGSETAHRLREDINEDISFKAQVKRYWKSYIPAALVVVATGVAVIGSNRISYSRNVALMGAAAISEQALRDFREKTIEVAGKAKEKKIRDDIVADKVLENKDAINKIVLQDDGKVLAFEPLTGRPFVSTAETIRRAENMVGRECINHDYASLNFFFRELSLPETTLGEELGWTNQNPIEIDLSTAQVHEGKPVLAINYVNMPKVGFYGAW